ncbi:hypothetical protein [Reichenbachiella versicolor]|uniref:hypothetical protein n=1 Tax=Reichenbachiella versicolor TaxID=1821036 RepID=UPI000D6E11D4|nr:hypothetical protein [Reichenbachiella versicolor]
MNNQTIDGQLLFAQNAITNAIQTPGIAEPLAEFGYDNDRLIEGQAKYLKAADLQTKQIKEYGEQYSATDALNQSRDLAGKLYMTHLKIARVALKGQRGVMESLQMIGRREKSLSGWLREAKAFYKNALAIPEVVPAMSRFSITAEKLQDGLDKISDVESKYNAQLKEKGEAQTATQLRDEAFDDLQEWMGDFLEISKIALEEQEQYLEILGVVRKN